MTDINQLVTEALSKTQMNRDIKGLEWRKKLMYGLSGANAALAGVDVARDRPGKAVLHGGLTAVTGLMGRKFQKEQQRLKEKQANLRR